MKTRIRLACSFLLLFASVAAAQRRPLPPSAVRPTRVDTSPPLAQLAASARVQRLAEPREINPHSGPALAGTASLASDWVDPLSGDGVAPLAPAPAPFMSFDGISNVNGVAPPDTQGDVGRDHYVQWVNLSIQIFDKSTGATVLGPVPGTSLWAGFGGACETNNDGDPIVLYDHLADRWFFSQLAIDADGHQCIAISQTGDPTGPYHRYDFAVVPGGLNDYPKFGLWPDGYYYSFNKFSPSFTSAVIGAFERDKMLVGDVTALLVFFEIPISLGGIAFAVEPANLEGSTPPPAGRAGLFVQPADSATWAGFQDRYDIWEVSVDYDDVPSSTATLFELTSGVPPFSSQVCVLFNRDCIPQPDTSNGLDSLSQFTMYRPVYRNFGTHETLLVNHTVNRGGGIAAVRWAEIRQPFGTPVLHQTGTHSPDADHRWMGSLAMDGDGNILLGYSKSSDSTFPSIAYAGRRAADPLGSLSFEDTLLSGSGSETGTNRWGDYSTMSVDELGDPDNGIPPDCAFWYTNEFVQTTGSFNWRTHVGAFRFPDCGDPGGAHGPARDQWTTPSGRRRPHAVTRHVDHEYDGGNGNGGARLVLRHPARWSARVRDVRRPEYDARAFAQEPPSRSHRRHHRRFQLRSGNDDNVRLRASERGRRVRRHGHDYGERHGVAACWCVRKFSSRRA